jgi:hypothetical protein
MRISLFHARNPNGKQVPVTVVIEQVVLLENKDGEDVYIVSLHTGAKSITGVQVDPVYINEVTKENLLEEISKGLTLIAEQINWGILEDDIYPPVISNIYPRDGSNNVSIDSNVSLSLQDPFPASFIDKDSIKLLVNGLDITSKVLIHEHSNEIRMSWVPTRIK